MRGLSLTLGMLLAVGIAIEPAAAEGQGRGREGRGNAGAEAATGSRGGMTEEIRKTIRDWFSDEANLANLPPGLARRESLPPGLQRQLRRNGTLPPGLAGDVQPLPIGLEEKLPPLGEGRTRGILGGNILILDDRTQEIIDIIVDLF